jgi:hypothetical protein
MMNCKADIERLEGGMARLCAKFDAYEAAALALEDVSMPPEVIDENGDVDDRVWDSVMSAHREVVDDVPMAVADFEVEKDAFLKILFSISCNETIGEGYG